MLIIFSNILFVKIRERGKMKRNGLYRPTVEDAIEIGGIETLHPGGFALTKRTAELAALREGLKVLDVSSGRGTQSIFYAKKFGVAEPGRVERKNATRGSKRSIRDRGGPFNCMFMR